MTDPNETAALKASVRGTVATAEALDGLRARVEALEPSEEIPPDLLDELVRVSAAHAVASAALRGLVGTMVTRRGAGTA